MRRKFLLCLLTSIMMFSCGDSKKNKKLAFYDNANSALNDSISNFESSDYEELDNSEIISIPFEEKDGVKYVGVSVNGFGFQMIFDTGCSTTLISLSEAKYLYEKGYLTSDDIIGFQKAQIADGSIVEDMVINLKEVVVGGKISCKNVEATVSSNNNAPLLLGNEILNRVAAYAVDNDNSVINFKLR